MLGGAIGRQTIAATKFNDELDKSVGTLQREADAIRNLPQSSTQVFTAAQPIISNARPQVDQIEELTQKLSVLYEEKQRLQTGGSPFGGLATPETARELERNKEATDALEDSLRKLQDARKGGSATELLENTQAEARAKFTLDESSAALALAASLDKQASETKNLQEAYALTKRASEERQKGEELAASVAEATARREAAAEVDGSAEQVEAIKRANAAKRAVTQPGSAERINLDAADEAAERKHQDQLTAEAASAEDTKYQIALKGLEERITVLREEASEQKISKQQEITALNTVYAQQGILEKAHQTTLMGLYDQGTAEYRSAQQKKLEVDAEINQKRLAAERQINQEIAAAQKQAIDQASSTFGSAITGIITGHERLGAAAKQIATQMLSTYLQLGVKMVLNNSGVIGQMIAQTVTGEAAKTATTIAGAQQRAADELAAQTAGATASMANALRMISQGAGETFAGVFGFLSPVLGPAAAGPAMAAAGQVMTTGTAMASFEMGSWSLPADMVAQVHQGEMIVPAGPAAAMRGALSGGQGGNAVHVHVTHAPVINAIDGDSIKRFYHGSEKQMFRQMNDAVRRGVHLGLTKLNPV